MVTRTAAASVSYTHLDVYKRQTIGINCPANFAEYPNQIAGILNNPEFGIEGLRSYLADCGSESADGLQVQDLNEMCIRDRLEVRLSIQTSSCLCRCGLQSHVLSLFYHTIPESKDVWFSAAQLVY